MAGEVFDNDAYAKALADRVAQHDQAQTAVEPQPQAAVAPDVMPEQAPAAPSYDDFFAERAAARHKQTTMMLEAAQKYAPEASASAMDLAKETGLPMDVVERNLDQLQKRKKFEQTQAVLRSSPVLAAQLGNPDFAKSTWDDTGALATLERWVGGAGYALAMGATVDIGAQLMSLEAAGIDIAGHMLPGSNVPDVFQRASKNLRERSLAATNAVENWRPQAQSSTEAAVMSGIESVGQQLPMMLVGGMGIQSLMAKGMSLAEATSAIALRSTVAMGAGTGAQAYAQAREQGASFTRSVLHGIAYGTIETATEYLPAEALWKSVFGGRGLGSTALKVFLAEFPGEQMATAGQDFLDWMNLPANKDKPISEFLRDRPDAAYQTFVATLVGVGLQSGAGHLIQRATSEKSAEQLRAEKLQKTFDAAKGTKTFSRSKQILSDFVGKATANKDGEQQTLFVDAQVLAQSAREMPPDEFAKILPSAVAQMTPEAIASNAPIELPMGEVVAHVPGTKLEQILVENHRTLNPLTGQLSTTLVESQQADELSKEMIDEQAAEVLKQAEDSQAWQAGIDKVQTALTETYTASGLSPDVAKSAAELHAKMYSVLASAEGLTADQLYKQYELRAASGMAADNALTQGVADQTNTPEFKAWFGGSKAVDASGKPVVVYHGTRRGGFTEFALTPGSRSAGFVFTSNREMALTYSGQDNNAEPGPTSTRAGLYSAFLSIQNPKVIDWQGDWFQKRSGEHTNDAIAQAKAEGYDGLIIRNVNDPGGFALAMQRRGKVPDGSAVKGDVYVAFSPKQIKSAIGNNGTFDPNDPNILRQSNDTANRGTFSVADFLMRIGPDADLSTVHHEAAHAFLEILSGIASREGASERTVGMFNTFLAWRGVASIEAWNALSFEQKRPHHEAFAEGFEQYLFEGKAPTPELQPLMRRFRAWMMQVYQSLTAFARTHSVQLSDEMRSVYDRMLATDEAIREAERAAGMLEDDEATNAAIEQLTVKSLQNLKWTEAAKSKIIRALQKDAAQKRKEVEAEVRAEVMASPVEKARDYLSRMTAGSVDGELMAEQLGFTSLDHMQKAIAFAPSAKDAIRSITDQRMLERYGDLNSPEALQEAANLAVHNEARARSLATELAAQQKIFEARADTGRTDRRGRPITANAMAAAAKQFASRIVSEKQTGELKRAAQLHRAAEAKASAEWLKATKVGKTAEAVRAKRTQMLHNAVVKGLLEAQQQVDKQVRYLKKFDSEGVRKNIDRQYLDQIDKLLERVDLRKVTNKEIGKRQALSEWIAQQQEQGLEPDLPDYLLEDARLTSYKQMTVEQLQGLTDAVKTIEHFGRLKNRLLAAKNRREFMAAVTEMAEGIRANGGTAIASSLEPETGLAATVFRPFMAEHRKLDSLLRQMDGGKEHGPMWELMGRGLNERGTWEATRVEQATEQMAAIMAPVVALPGGMSGAKVFIPSLGDSLSRQGRLAVALNWGNETNRQRIVDGNHISPMAVQEILATLSPTELKFVNQMWEFVDSFWPEVSAKQERVTGYAPEKVKATAFTATASDGSTVDMRGGYWPIKYDATKSDRTDAQEAAQIGEEIKRGAFTRSTTARSHTKARVDTLNRAIRLDLLVATQHVNQVIHDLAWHEWLIDANRLMRAEPVTAAIRQHYGNAVMKTIKDALSAIATGDIAPQDSWDKVMMMARKNVSRAMMGFSMTSALLQPFGLTQSMVRIGSKHVFAGMRRWAGDTMKMESTVAWVNEKSPFMRLRWKTQNRELFEISNKLKGKSKFEEIIDTGLFLAMRKMQTVADIPTWVGQYEKYMAQGADESEAIAQADRAVQESQGGGQTKDLSAVQRKHPLWTMFYSYFNTTLNLGIEKTATTNFKNPKAVAGWVGDMALLFVIPALGPAIVTALMVGGDDDDPEEWAKKLAKAQASYLLGSFVGLRELSSLAAGFDYSGPPFLRSVVDLGKFAQQVAQGEADEAAVLSAIRLAGSALGLPTTQLIRSYRGWEEWSQGRASPASILFGPPQK